MAEVAPAAMVTLWGTVKYVWSELRATRNPDWGAGVLRVIVPDPLFPPIMLVGERVRVWMEGAFTESTSVTEVAPRVAVIFAATELPLALVEMVKVPMLLPPVM